MTDAPLVLITGAGGFIGSAKAKALRDVGFRVRAGLRRAARAPDEVLCDLDRPEQIRAAMAGVDLVVHAAYSDSEAMPRQAENLLAAMAEQGVANLIALSSIAVHGDASGDVDATRRGALDAYGAAKLACEAATRAWANAAPERRALNLRPGIVYGTGSAFWIDKLVERIRAGVWADFGPDGEGVAALIHVDDLSGIILAAARALLAPSRLDLAACTTLNAIGPETPSWNGYFHALAVKLGAAPLPRRGRREIALRQQLAVPAKIWVRLGLPGARARAAALAPTPGEIALFSRRALYARDRVADFQPSVGLAEGLARTRLL